MKVIVTGLNGFLGKNLLESLNKKKISILGIIKNKKLKKKFKEIKIIKADIGSLTKKNLSDIKSFKPEILINLAWKGIPDYSAQNNKENIRMHKSFISEVTKLKSLNKIIMTGSCWEYKDNIGKCKEDTKRLSNASFSKSKVYLYNYIRKVTSIKGIDFVWLRIFFMYGNYQKKKSLIPSILQSLHKGKKPTILNYANKNDYIHVKDVCELINIIINSKKIKSGIYNVGSSHLSSVSEVYNKILNLLNLSKYCKKNEIKIKNKIKFNRADINKVKYYFKWKPKISLDSGIKSMVKNYNG